MGESLGGCDGKRKRRKTKRQTKLKQAIKFEVGALLLLTLSIISILQLGIVGKGFVYFFRFIAGEWYIILPLFFIGLSSYLIWKRAWPNFANRKFVGLCIIFPQFYY